MTTATTIVAAYHSTSIYLWTPQSNFIHRNAQLLIFNFSTRPSKSQMRAIYLFIFFHSFEMTSLKLLIPSWFLIIWFYYLFFVCFRPFFPLFLFFIVSSCLARRDAKVTSTSYTRRGMQISLHQLFCLFFFLSLSLSLSLSPLTLQGSQKQARDSNCSKVAGSLNSAPWGCCFSIFPFLDTNADLFVINCANESINKALPCTHYSSSYRRTYITYVLVLR